MWLQVNKCGLVFDFRKKKFPRLVQRMRLRDLQARCCCSAPRMCSSYETTFTGNGAGCSAPSQNRWELRSASNQSKETAAPAASNVLLYRFPVTSAHSAISDCHYDRVETPLQWRRHKNHKNIKIRPAPNTEIQTNRSPPRDLLNRKSP